MDTDFLRNVVVVICAAGLVASVAIAVRQMRPHAGDRRALAWSDRSGLPLDEATEAAVSMRLRRDTAAQAIGAAGGFTLSLILALTPLGHTPTFFLAVLLPALLIPTLIAQLTVALHDHVFAPLPDQVRVARARSVRVSDYLAPPKLALPWILTATAAALAVWVAAGGVRAGQGTQLAALGLTAVAVLACALTPALDRRILERPQPATTPVVLAWDDLLRTVVMNTVRLTVCVLSLSGIALSIMALTGWDAALPMQLIVWGQIIQSQVYPASGRGLKPALRPRATSAVHPS